MSSSKEPQQTKLAFTSKGSLKLDVSGLPNRFSDSTPLSRSYSSNSTSSASSVASTSSAGKRPLEDEDTRSKPERRRPRRGSSRKLPEHLQGPDAEARRAIAKDNAERMFDIVAALRPDELHVRTTKFMRGMPDALGPEKMHRHRTRFALVNADSFSHAEVVVAASKGKEVTVLNMANSHTPGGGYLMGAGAQEESLCRRSTLYTQLTPPSHHRETEIPWGKRFDNYPFPAVGGAYSKGVVVFRGPDDEGNPVWEEDRWFDVSVISVAALSSPHLTMKDFNSLDVAYLRDDDLRRTRDKITMMLRACAQEGAHILILGAWGCGAFRNPPWLIARLFKDALVSDSAEFAGAFEEVHFAILERADSTNFEPFAVVFKDELAASEI